MAIFDYQCAQCSTVFDIYHRGKESAEKIKCPACGSAEYKKLVSVPAAVGAGAGTKSSSGDACDSPMGGCCGGGMCGMN